MGLDMYLYGVMYLSDYNVQEKRIAEQIQPIFLLEGFDLPTPKYVKWELGYWRKANAVHNWFVQNVQDGNDNCGDYYVSAEKLRELRLRCLAVLKRKRKLKGYKLTADEKKTVANWEPGDGGLYGLTPVSGFFFGSTEVDEYLYSDFAQTVEIIDRCLKLSDKLDFQYHSSW